MRKNREKKMLDETIKEGMSVKVYPAYRKKVTDMTDDSSQMICVGKIDKLPAEYEIEVEVYQSVEQVFQKKKSYVMYFMAPGTVLMCHVSFLSFYTEDNKRKVSFKMVSPLEKIQRRMHQRVSYHTEISFQILDETQIAKEKQKNNCLFQNVAGNSFDNNEDTIVDISGGGIRFTSKKEIKPGSFIVADFKSIIDKKNVVIHVLGQIVYCAVLRNEKERFDIRMKYINLTEEDKEKIIHFVFELERNQRNVKLRRGGE